VLIGRTRRADSRRRDRCLRRYTFRQPLEAAATVHITSIQQEKPGQCAPAFHLVNITARPLRSSIPEGSCGSYSALPVDTFPLSPTQDAPVRPSQSDLTGRPAAPSSLSEEASDQFSIVATRFRYSRVNKSIGTHGARCTGIPFPARCGGQGPFPHSPHMRNAPVRSQPIGHRGAFCCSSSSDLPARVMLSEGSARHSGTASMPDGSVWAGDQLSPHASAETLWRTSMSTCCSQRLASRNHITVCSLKPDAGSDTTSGKGRFCRAWRS
jgi:hypothetical protein